MSSEGQSPAYLEVQGFKFENRAFDSQSVSFEKETEEREGEDREEIVNDTGNSVCWFGSILLTALFSWR